MSHENVGIQRQPIRLESSPRRHLDERLSLRFPRVRVALTRALFRLPARSRIRTVMLSRAVRLGVEASSGGDYDSAFSFYHPDAELVTPPEAVVVTNFPANVKGRRERVRLERMWRAEWGDFRYEPEELIDLQDQVLLLGRMVGSGPSSSAASESEWADLLTISKGQVVREEVFFNRADALTAVGLED
jgi:ketosteroid isomerase-like protein